MVPVKRWLYRVYGSPPVRKLGKAGLLALSSRLPVGTNVLEREWDLLVVLDTCRLDALRTVAPEYPFLDRDGVDRLWSVGSATREWTANTFTAAHADEIERTALVNGNVNVSDALDGPTSRVESPVVDRVAGWRTVSTDDFYLFDPVWKYTPQDPFAGTTLPGAVTDRAIAVGRRLDPDRLIAHYIPPHSPYRAGALRENRSQRHHEARPWEYLLEGNDDEPVRAAYLDELRWGLDRVSVLLENVDAETVFLTADHGETFGERGLYGHPSGVPHPLLRAVPWAETSATDTGSYVPQLEPSPADLHGRATDAAGAGGTGDAGVARSARRSVDQQLDALGYT